MGLSLWIARSDLIAARRVSIAFAAKGPDSAAIDASCDYPLPRRSLQNP
jgi:hypothetical protein